MKGKKKQTTAALTNANNELDMAGVVFALTERGFSPPEIAKVLGTTPPTIRARIADMQAKQGVILQYRELQHLRVTELQHSVLEAMSPEKIADAPLNVLAQCYKILKDKELLMTGKPTEIKGLVGYLIELEKQEAATERPVELSADDVPSANLPVVPNLH